jgi:hypothetical protein
MKKAAVPSILVAVVLLALGVIAQAQQPKKVSRIGYLSSFDPAIDSDGTDAIRLALHERGHIEGQKTSPPSTDMRRGSSIGSLSLRPSWCASRLISLW